MNAPGLTLLVALFGLGLGTAHAEDPHPDQITNGEQGTLMGSTLDAGRTEPGDRPDQSRRLLATLDGVAQVSGARNAIFTLKPGAQVPYTAIKQKLEATQGVVVKPPVLGFDLTVDIIFDEARVTAEQVPAIIDAMPTHDELTEVSYVSGHTIRIKTAPWDPRNQRGFKVLDLIYPAARATGYRGPGAPTFDTFIKDIVFHGEGV